MVYLYQLVQFYPLFSQESFMGMIYHYIFRKLTICSLFKILCLHFSEVDFLSLLKINPKRPLQLFLNNKLKDNKSVLFYVKLSKKDPMFYLLQFFLCLMEHLFLLQVCFQLCFHSIMYLVRNLHMELESLQFMEG